MTSTYLTLITDVDPNQNNKETTINAQTNSLDLAINQITAIVVTVSFQLTAVQSQENFVLNLTGTPGAPFNMDMADTSQRVIAVLNNTDDVATVRNSAGGGTGQPVIAVGEGAIFHYDGTNFLELSAGGGASDFLSLSDTPGSFTAHQRMVTNSAANALQSQDIPYDIAWINAGTPAINSTVFRFTYPRAVRIPDDFTLSNGSVGTNPSSQTDFDVQRNTVSFGTISVSTGGVVSFSTAATTEDFASGDEIDVVAPGNLNGLVDLNITLAGILRSGT